MVKRPSGWEIVLRVWPFRIRARKKYAIFTFTASRTTCSTAVNNIVLSSRCEKKYYKFELPYFFIIKKYFFHFFHYQQYENVNNCLNALRALHCEVDAIKANDICAGRLKAILTLFFSLSQHKQTASHKQKLGGSSAIKTQQPMPLQQQQMSHTIERWVRRLWWAKHDAKALRICATAIS